MTQKNIQKAKENAKSKSRMAPFSYSDSKTFEHGDECYENGIVEELEESPRISLNTLVKSRSKNDIYHEVDQRTSLEKLFP